MLTKVLSNICGGIMIKKNEEYITKIQSFTNEGFGVAKIDGFAVFVPYSVVDDEVRVKILSVKKTYAYGKILGIITPSKHRTNAPCPHFGKCGGCSLLHIDYNYQKELKKQFVHDSFTRIGGFLDIKIEDTTGMDEPDFYRNKAVFPVGEADGKAQIGMYAPRSHRVVPIEECFIQNKVSVEVMKIVKEWIEKYNIPVYNEENHTGLIRHVFTRIGDNTKELMVSIVVNGKKIKHSDKLVQMLASADLSPYCLVSVMQNINTKKGNVILGDESVCLYGREYIHDSIGDLKFQISNGAFYQVNPKITKLLYEKALELCDLKGDETVFDLYCGIGTISLFLAKHAKKVIGVEIVPQAVEDAKANAKLNNIENVQFYTGEAENVVPKLYEEGIKADVVVVDPPRKGCDRKLLDTIVKMNPQKIVYVSCDSATLARDAKILSEHGFYPEKVFPFDQFPHTAHVECVTLMSRVEK